MDGCWSWYEREGDGPAVVGLSSQRSSLARLFHAQSGHEAVEKPNSMRLERGSMSIYVSSYVLDLYHARWRSMVGNYLICTVKSKNGRLYSLAQCVILRSRLLS